MPGTAIAYAIQLLALFPQLMAAGIQVKDMMDAGREKLEEFQREDRDPTPEEWDKLNASIEVKRKALHAPFPNL